jgi:hypothetical protein
LYHFIIIEEILRIRMRAKTRAELDRLGDIHKGTNDESIQRLIVF